MVAAWSVRRKLLRQPKIRNYNFMLDLTAARASIQTMILRFFCKNEGNLGTNDIGGVNGVNTFCFFYSFHFLVIINIKVMDSKRFWPRGFFY